MNALIVRALAIFFVVSPVASLAAEAAERQPDPTLGVPPADSKLLTRYFRIVPSILNSHDFPAIEDGLEADDLTRATNSQKWLEEAAGVTFPAGASAVYYPGAGFLLVRNTLENIRKVAQIVRDSDPIVKMIQLDLRVVEFRPDIEGRLYMKGGFEKMQRELGEAIKTVCISSIITKSGQRATGNTSSPSGLSPTQRSTKKNEADEVSRWPPSSEIEKALFEIEPTISGKEDVVDSQFAFKYASPPTSNHPSLLIDVSTNVALKVGHIINIRTFTVRDRKAKADQPRHYAILVGCEIVDVRGATTGQLREELEKKARRPKTGAASIPPGGN